MVMEQHLDERDDVTLVNATRAGDRDAFDLLLDRHYPTVTRLCQRLLGSTADAWDIAQEAALQAFLGLDRLNDAHRFSAWFQAIAANLARKALRRRHILSLEALEPSVTYSGLLSDVAATPEDAYVVKEIHDAIVLALRELSAVNRAAVVGYFIDGYGYDELAALLQVPVSTVRGRLFQGRRQLRRALAGYESPKRMSQKPQKETPMHHAELVQLELAGFTAAPWDQRNLVLLRTVGAQRDLPLRLSVVETEALSHSRYGEALPPQPAVHDLTLRLLSELGAKVRHIVIRRLVGTTYYVTMTVDHNGRPHEVDAELGAALVLASSSNTPIYTTPTVLDQAGIEIAPLIDQWQHDPVAREEIKQRMVERIRQDGMQPADLDTGLAPHVEQRISACLGRLLTSIDGRLVLLTAQNGRLLMWRGEGDDESIALWSQIRLLQERDPADVRDLLAYMTLLLPEVWQGVMVTRYGVGTDWRLEVGLGPLHDAENWDATRRSLRQTARELEDLLSDSTANID